MNDLGLRRAALGVLIIVVLAASAGACLAVSLQQEIKIGQEASVEVEKEMPLSKNKAEQDAIEAMGKKLIPFVKRKSIPYHFRIVVPKDHMLNAFALPGGYVYFTERMWTILTPDERAAVMAHEISHCDLRHGIDQSIKEQQRLLWTLPLIALGGSGGEAWMVGNMAVSARYSRVCERQADENGMRLLHKAGFNPAGAVTSMKKLLSIENDQNHYEVSAIFADHPDTQKRVDYLTQEAIALGAMPSEFELPIVDDPQRLGNITRKVPDMAVLYARTSTPLQYDQKVLIKKMLWDDKKNALGPVTIAEAVVLTPGTLPTLVLVADELYNHADVMVGDGVYPVLTQQPVDNAR